MYDQHFGLTGRPFQLTPDPGFWFGTATHRKAMAYLGYGLAQGEGFIVVTGDIGAGKTTLMGHLLDGLDRARLNPITITSTAGLVGSELCTAYAASKFALEGWMDSLRFDLEPFGISTMAVEPGFFRTELLVEGASTLLPELDIEDYAERTQQMISGMKGMNGQQAGDPDKLARAIVTLSDTGTLPLRFVAGTDAMDAVEGNLAAITGQIEAHRALSASLAHGS